MWWLVAPVQGAMPLPDYRDELVQVTWHRVNSLIEAACDSEPGARCNPEPLDEAIARATAFQAQVTPDARLEYLIGLAWRARGDPGEAEQHLRAALVLDENRADAWHDLGELLLSQSRYDDAGEAFAHVSRLVDSGSKAWVGPWRQAEVAAHLKDPDAFERHMKIALERGFSFRTIRGTPNWKGFAADPVMGPSVAKLITVYGTPDVLESLQP